MRKVFLKQGPRKAKEMAMSGQTGQRDEPNSAKHATPEVRREAEEPRCTRALLESHTKIISICSDGASPNSTARGPDDSPCATTRGRTYRQSSRAGGRAATNMVLNPTVREPWQKLKEYFMN